MITKDGHKKFDACLKNESGEVLAMGEASISVQKRHVTFKSNFVPLYPMGTPMEIVRLLDGVEIHRFTGKVYLSDKKLMRIVSVDDELLPGSQFCYCDKFSFAGTVRPCFEYIKQDKWQFIKSRKQEELPREFGVVIIGMTINQLVFTFDETVGNEEKHTGVPANNLTVTSMLDVKVGDRFLMNMSEPISLDQITIEMTKPLYFGPKPSYVCDIMGLDPLEHKHLSNFLWKYNKAKNKVF